jgi:hypothetical protein
MLSHLRRSTYELHCLRAKVHKLLVVFGYKRCLVVSLRIFFFPNSQVCWFISLIFVREFTLFQFTIWKMLREIQRDGFVR